LDWLSVDFDEALATGDVIDSCCVFLSTNGLRTEYLFLVFFYSFLAAMVLVLVVFLLVIVIK
jgi:hypothetical protein